MPRTGWAADGAEVRRVLIALAVVGLGGAVAIGIYSAATVSWTLLPFVAAGAFLVLAYDLEWFGGRFHTDLWFAAAWGAFPAATGFWRAGGWEEQRHRLRFVKG